MRKAKLSKLHSRSKKRTSRVKTAKHKRAAASPKRTALTRGNRKAKARNKVPAKRTKTVKPVTRARTAHFKLRDKRTFQQTADLAKEVVRFRTTKGRRISSTQENAEKILDAAVKKAKKKFSHKSGKAFSAHIVVKWKNSAGKWVHSTYTHTGKDFEQAIIGLLNKTDVFSNSYEKTDKDTGKVTRVKIRSKEKKIVGVSFDKFTAHERKLPKATRKKRGA